jgi:hypothetical protein
VTFFFDNTFSVKIVKILRILDVDAIHLQEKFTADTPDVDWLPTAGQNAWVVITGDHRLSKFPAERIALEQASVVAVFFYKGFTSVSGLLQVSFVAKHWPAIEHAVHKQKPGSNLRINANGQIEVM